MSMSEIRVLTREQRGVLKTLIPTYVLIKSGSAEELETFWESVYVQWFQTWPEHDVHYPDIPPNELSDLQRAWLNTAVDRRRRVSRFLAFNSRIQVPHIEENSFVHSNEPLAYDLAR